MARTPTRRAPNQTTLGSGSPFGPVLASTRSAMAGAKRPRDLGACAGAAPARRGIGTAIARPREVEPFLADLRIGVRKDDDAVERRDDRRAVAARADPLAR